MTSRCLNCGSMATEPWAEATDIEYATSTRRWAYHRCGACGVVFLADPPVERLTEVYPSNYSTYEAVEPSRVERVKASFDIRTLRRAFEQVGGETISLLDVGGGVGALASAARKSDSRVHRTTVLDLDPRCEAAATARGHRYACSRAEEFTPDAPFDVILLYNVLEHSDDPRALLRRLRQLLNADGVLIVKTPNHDSLDARLFRHRSWAGLDCPRHRVLYDRASLRLAARAAGLRPTTVRYVQGSPFWGVGLSVGALGPARDAGHPVRARLSYKAGWVAGAAFDIVRAPFAPTSQMVAFLHPENP